MRHALASAVVSLAVAGACKADPSPVREAHARIENATNTHPRQAKLPFPTRTNALVIGLQLRAETAWTDATAANTAEAWDLAAELFARARDACSRDCAEIAYATVLARSNALKADPALVHRGEKPVTPQPMPERVEAFVDAADAYVATAAPGDDDAIGISFLAGQQYNNYGYVDESTTRFASIVFASPTHDVALYSANLMLDAFNRSERYDDLLRWARDLQANSELMAAHTELAELVAAILARAARAN